LYHITFSVLAVCVHIHATFSQITSATSLIKLCVLYWLYQPCRH